MRHVLMVKTVGMSRFEIQWTWQVGKERIFWTLAQCKVLPCSTGGVILDPSLLWVLFCGMLLSPSLCVYFYTYRWAYLGRSNLLHLTGMCSSYIIRSNRIAIPECHWLQSHFNKMAVQSDRSSTIAVFGVYTRSEYTMSFTFQFHTRYTSWGNGSFQVKSLYWPYHMLIFTID